MNATDGGKIGFRNDGLFWGIGRNSRSEAFRRQDHMGDAIVERARREGGPRPYLKFSYGIAPLLDCDRWKLD